MEPTIATSPLLELLRVLRRRGLWVLLAALIVGGAVYFLEARKPNRFLATSLVDYQPDGLNLINLVGVSTPSSPQDSVTNPQLLTAASLAVSPQVAGSVASRVGHGLSRAEVLADVTVTADSTGATLLSVAAKNASANLAISISRTYATEYVQSQEAQIQQTVSAAISAINRQVTAATRTGGPGQATTLSGLYTRVSQLQQISALSQPPVQVGSLALTASPSGPHKVRSALIAALLALVITLTLAVSLDRVGQDASTSRETAEVGRGAPIEPATQYGVAVRRFDEAMARGARGADDPDFEPDPPAAS